MEGDSQNQTVKVEQTEEIVQATEDVTTAETSAQEKVPSSEGSTNSSEGFVKLDELEDNGSTPTQEEVQPIESCEAEETHQDFTKLTPSSEAAPDTNAEEAPEEEVKEEPPIVEEIAQVAKDVEPQGEEKPSAMAQVMKVLSDTNLNNIIPTNKQEAIDLLYWRDIPSSAVVFLVAMLTLYALSTSSCLLVASYMFMSALTVTNLLKIFKWVMGLVTGKQQGNPMQQFLEMNMELNEECVQEYTKIAVKHVNWCLVETRDLVFVKNVFASLKFFIICWAMGFVGATFNFLTLLMIATVFAFTWPLFYEKYQTCIDKYYAIAKGAACDLCTKVRNVVPGLKPKTE